MGRMPLTTTLILTSVLLIGTPAFAATDHDETTSLKLEADRMENQFRGVLTDKKGIALKSADHRAFRLYCDSKNNQNIMSLEYEENHALKILSLTTEHASYVSQCRDTIDEIWNRLVGKGQKLILLQAKDSFHLDKFTEN